MRSDQFQRFGLLGFLILIGAFFGVASPYFISWENITNILVQSAVLIILGSGMTLVIATAGIDLSIGSILSIVQCSGHGVLRACAG